MMHYLSRLIQPRGLKYNGHSSVAFSVVEAYTASWIEILFRLLLNTSGYVEAYTASWIEM